MASVESGAAASASGQALESAPVHPVQRPQLSANHLLAASSGSMPSMSTYMANWAMSKLVKFIFWTAAYAVGHLSGKPDHTPNLRYPSFGFPQSCVVSGLIPHSGSVLQPSPYSGNSMNLPSYMASMKFGVQLNNTTGSWLAEAVSRAAHKAPAVPAFSTMKFMPRPRPAPGRP
ncbi:MAG: hypothetical protein CM1200mP26_18220 [Acidimicrobiales bacterium]|nr:MAG: hypothetical protein CM1200mP26_18220 [Acidimicrobiales bacterium]